MPSEPEERLVEQLGVVFGLFVLLVVIATLARRIKVPYPILLVVGGLLIGLLPGLPTVELDPELVLLIFLPRCRHGRRPRSLGR
jgi:NhaP-type Na+/H+ or K+/H+ antiporter